MRGVISFLLLIGMCFAQAQEPDSTQTILLEDLTITAYQEIPERETSIHITSIGLDTLTSYSHHNLTELMSRTPGVSMLTMGMGISKPVIRGLYGNRTLVLLSGLKFDNQQWQEEHGLGLTDFGLSRVELIKGPMSVLYGSEAMGGVINLIEEKKPALHQSQSEIGPPAQLQHTRRHGTGRLQSEQWLELVATQNWQPKSRGLHRWPSRSGIKQSIRWILSEGHLRLPEKPLDLH